MTELTELKREASRRQRVRTAVAAVVAAVVVAGGVWLLVDRPGPSAEPPATGVPTASIPTHSGFFSPPTAGGNLRPQLTAEVPEGFTVDCDCETVWLSNAATGNLFIGGPVVQVWNPVTHKPVPPPKDYAGWLRSNRWLTLVAERAVVVDGQSVPVLTMRVRADAVPGAGQTDLRFARVAYAGQPWVTQSPSDTFTEAVLTVGGKTMLVRAFGASSSDRETLLQSELLAFLDSLHRP